MAIRKRPPCAGVALMEIAVEVGIEFVDAKHTASQRGVVNLITREQYLATPPAVSRDWRNGDQSDEALAAASTRC